ncbi:Surface lipoprotein [Alteromonas naphthalenivorans]|uniref:Surface lipoprotein n=1 Tax=Alteromonas naphthalenivorans TaxID=715451 RepID=F5Z4N7_ALTNA|nr:Surface lipoprotein [Alteromonas naphthalenivorans]
MIKFSKWVSVSALLLASLLGGCASQQVSQQVEQNNTSVQDAGDPRDPLEPVNRVMWDFNWEVLDAYVLRPITVGYVTVMPQFARTGLLNAAENLQEPANFMNNMFQGKVDDGMDSLARFVLNSTVGLFGTIDVASHIGIVEKEEEFGETMGVWGVNTGPYLMLPALGPNDPRSFTGSVVDGMVYPMAIIDGQFAIARYLVSLLEGRASLIDQEQQLEQSVDDYAFVKNAYFENLAFKVTDGKSGDKALEEDQLDDFAEFEAMLEYEETDVEADDSKEEPEEDGPEGN